MPQTAGHARQRGGQQPAVETLWHLRIQDAYDKDFWLDLEMTGSEEHPHDNYGEPMRLVNSPRSGMCGYDGPAEPPY